MRSYQFPESLHNNHAFEWLRRAEICLLTVLKEQQTNKENNLAAGVSVVPSHTFPEAENLRSPLPALFGTGLSSLTEANMEPILATVFTLFLVCNDMSFSSYMEICHWIKIQDDLLSRFLTITSGNKVILGGCGGLIFWGPLLNHYDIQISKKSLLYSKI